MKNKKLFAILTLVCFMFTLMPVAAFADETTDPYAGYAVVEVATQEELNDAIANAEGATKIVLNGESFEPFTHSGTPGMQNKDIVFYGGTENTVIDATSVNHNGMQHITGATLTFDNVTVNWKQANEGYHGLANAKKVVYRDCNITGTQFMYGDADFINCTLETYNGYCVYGRGAGTLTFTDCTFNTGGRAIMLYADQSTNVEAKLDNCKFYSNGIDKRDKAAVETGDSDTSGSVFKITLNNCTEDGFVTNNSTSPLWGE